MVYDCFTFFNELDILKIRLHELDSVVDKFIIVEGTVTFTNQHKPLNFKANKDLFKDYEKKIIYIVVSDSPNSPNPWEIERFQFNAISRGLKLAKDNDTILLSCVDEIPKSQKVFECINKKNDAINIFLQTLSYYYLNLISKDKSWEGTRMAKRSKLQLEDLYKIRQSSEGVKIKDAGWHFSYMGGFKKIQEKINAFSHQEYNKDIYTSKENIKNSIMNMKDLYSRNIKFQVSKYGLLPQYVQENIGMFSEYLLPEPKSFINQISTFLKILKNEF